MALTTARRSVERGRPPGLVGGRCGSMIAHAASLTSVSYSLLIRSLPMLGRSLSNQRGLLAHPLRPFDMAPSTVAQSVTNVSRDRQLVHSTHAGAARHRSLLECGTGAWRHSDTGECPKHEVSARGPRRASRFGSSGSAHRPRSWLHLPDYLACGRGVSRRPKCQV